MRADRLVAVLLLLQQRGRVTVAEVAAELEVSPRTARRDLEALGIAGLPVYSVAGRGGGWRLAGGGRIDLSGLNAAETRALFMVTGPSSATTPELRAALRKLVRALPEQFRETAHRAREAVVVDPREWGRGGDRPGAVTPPLLEPVQRAVIDQRQLRLVYTSRDGDRSDRVVEPLGLAAKGGHWYLVAATDAGLRTFRVDRIDRVEATGQAATRPDGFELSQAWALIADRVEELRTPVVAHALVDRTMAPVLSFVLGPRARVGVPAVDGRVAMELRGHHVRELAAHLGGFGAAVEVTDPPELRAELARVGRELSERYGS